MRLIDADKLENALNTFKDYKNGNEHFLFGIETARELVSEAMTVDAIPVAHGEWENKEVFNIEDTQIEEMQSASCSKCGLFHTTPYLYWFDSYKFCPNCGAKMDGEGRCR